MKKIKNVSSAEKKCRMGAIRTILIRFLFIFSFD